MSDDRSGRTKVKICGIRDEPALDAATDAGADWIGFVFFARSPRCIAPQDAAVLYRRLDGKASAVGLFVEPDEADIERVLQQVPLDILQLYTTPERAGFFRSRFGRPVWLAYGVSRRDQLPTTHSLDGLVIESRAPDDASRPGGNGLSFDWSILQGWHAPAPWLLAGGLTPDNVGGAIAQSGASAVDVSSGVESSPGCKDPALIHRFVRSAGAG
ncbi:MAG: phosphoribosylanthranilate isomerase [Janthinobacterium lividum]